MNPRILSLVFAPFAFGTSAFVFIGLIDPMAEGLGVGVPLIGQLQMVFAIACGFGGPFLARLLSGVDRKRLLVGVLASMVAMNFASASGTEISQHWRGCVSPAASLLRLQSRWRRPSASTWCLKQGGRMLSPL
jgi:MFS family permease